MAKLISRMGNYVEKVGTKLVFKDEIGMTHSLDPYFVQDTIRDHLKKDDKVWLEYHRNNGTSLWWATHRDL